MFVVKDKKVQQYLGRQLTKDVLIQTLQGREVSVSPIDTQEVSKWYRKCKRAKVRKHVRTFHTLIESALAERDDARVIAAEWEESHGTLDLIAGFRSAAGLCVEEYDVSQTWMHDLLSRVIYSSINFVLA